MMKKLFWSAFALSLMAFGVCQAQDDLAQIEAELLPEFKGAQEFSPPDMHQDKSWNVKADQVVQDKEPLKGQGHSIIPWEDLDPIEWLDINTWLVEREIKDKNPDWKIRLRDTRQMEIMGKVLSCAGTCKVYRGTMPASVQHLSRVVEGDEFVTEENTSAWVFLMDGGLLRVGPESSVSFQEINISEKEFFYLVRLNKGHVYWHPRQNYEFPFEDGPETDSRNLPVKIAEANQGHFERKIFRSQNDQAQLEELLELDERALLMQWKKLNSLRVSNLLEAHLPATLMLVAPNATFVSKGASFDVVYLFGGPSHFKKRGAGELSLQLRGYNEVQTHVVSENTWTGVSPNGRKKYPTGEVGDLQLLELLTKRIKTIELAREHWIRDFTLPLLKALKDPKKLAVEHGYPRWEAGDLERRVSFLTEYTRRIETTHLRSVQNLLVKHTQEGEKLNQLPDFYQDAVNHYLLGLKSRYSDKKIQVRAMSDLQYHIWTLTNGRL